jgi:hypothetical protein
MKWRGLIVALAMAGCSSELPPLSRWSATVSEHGRFYDFYDSRRATDERCARLLTLTAHCCGSPFVTDQEQSGDLQVVLPAPLVTGQTITVDDSTTSRYAVGGQAVVYASRHLRGTIDVLSLGKRAQLRLKLVATQPRVDRLQKGDRVLEATVSAALAPAECSP